MLTKEQIQQLDNLTGMQHADVTKDLAAGKANADKIRAIGVEQPSVPSDNPIQTQPSVASSNSHMQGFTDYANSIKNAAGNVVSPISSVGKSIFDITAGKDFSQAQKGIGDMNNTVLNYIKDHNLKPGDPAYESLMKTVTEGQRTARDIKFQGKQARKDVGFGLPGENEAVTEAIDKGNYGRAALSGATSAAAGFSNAVFSPLAVPAKTLLPNEGVVGDVVRGGVTGAGLGGPMGAVAGTVFGLLPTVISKVKEIPGIRDHLAQHPEDEKLFNDSLNLGMTALAGVLAKKTAPEGQKDIFNTPVSEVPGRIGQNLYNTAAIPVKAASGAAKKLADVLEKENLRLTPAQKSNTKLKIDDVIDYNERNGITGNPEKRFEKISDNVNQKENTYQNFLTKGDGKDVTISKDNILTDLRDLKNKYESGNTLDLNSSVNKIDRAISRIQRYPGDSISASDINELKRDAFNSAYSSTGNNKLLDPVHNEIGGILKGNLEKATDGLTIDGKTMAEFNKDYGVALTSKQLLQIAKGKSQLGLLGKITAKSVGGGTGGMVGGPAGAALGAIFGDKVAEALLGTNVRSHLSSLLSYLSGADEENSILSSIKNIPNKEGGFIKVPGNEKFSVDPASYPSVNEKLAAQIDNAKVATKAPMLDSSIEAASETAGGWQPGMKQMFDTALAQGDKMLIQALLHENAVPSKYVQLFSKEISKIINK